MSGFQPNATARGRLATEIEAAFTDEWGHVGGVAASGRRWRVAYAAADRILAAGLAPDDEPGEPPES